MIAEEFYEQEEQPIDMRLQSDEPCIAYDFAGLTHHFPISRLTVFEKALELFDDVYTVGVKHATMQGALTSLQQQKSNTAQGKQTAFKPLMPLVVEPAIIDLNYHVHRKEHRLNFISPVEIHINDMVFAAKTADLSPHGLKVYIDEVTVLQTGDEIELRFVGLAERVKEIPFDKIPFRIMGIESAKERTTLRLMRLPSYNEQSFIDFINDFVKKNASRYKYELSDHIKAVKTDIAKFAYCQHLVEIPVVFAKNKKLKLILKSKNNAILSQLLAANFSFQLETVIGRKLTSRISSSSHILGIIAIDPKAQEDIHWLLPEDIESNQHKLLFAVSANVINWPSDKVFNDWMDAFSHLNELDRKDIMQLFESLQWIAYLRPINAVLYHQSDAESLIDVKTDVKLPDSYFLQSEQSPLVGIDLIFSNQDQLFDFESDIILHVDGRKTSGKMLQFNADYVEVVLDKSPDLESRQEVQVTFNGIMNQYKKVKKLERQAYRMSWYDKWSRRLKLKVDFRKSKHPARDFFQDLIERNRDKLVVNTDQDYRKEMRRILINLLAMNQATPPLIASRAPKKGYFADAIGASHMDSQMSKFMHNGDDIIWPLIAQPEVLEQVCKAAESVHGKINRKGTLDVIFCRKGMRYEFAVCNPDQSLLEQIAPYIHQPNYRFARYIVSPRLAIPLDEISENYNFIWQQSRNQAKLLSEFYANMLTAVEIWDLTLLLKPIVASMGESKAKGE